MSRLSVKLPVRMEHHTYESEPASLATWLLRLSAGAKTTVLLHATSYD